MPGTVVGDGELQRLADRGVKVLQGPGQGGGGDPQVLGAHAVEALGGVTQGGGPAPAHVSQDGGHRLEGGGDVDLGARQDRGELAG